MHDSTDNYLECTLGGAEKPKERATDSRSNRCTLKMLLS